MNAPWLFAEAYKYRRLHECFSVSKFWKNYDVFYRQKVRNSYFPLFTTNDTCSATLSRVQLTLSLNCLCDLRNHSKAQRGYLLRKS